MAILVSYGGTRSSDVGRITAEGRCCVWSVDSASDEAPINYSLALSSASLPTEIMTCLVSCEASFQNSSYTKYMHVDEFRFPYTVSSFVDYNLSISKLMFATLFDEFC